MLTSLVALQVFSIEMLWYLVLTYWVGLAIIALYEILWKNYKSKSNTIWATMWENDSLRKKFTIIETE